MSFGYRRAHFVLRNTVYLLLQLLRVNYPVTRELLLQTLCSYFNVVMDLLPFRMIPDEGQSQFSAEMA